MAPVLGLQDSLALPALWYVKLSSTLFQVNGRKHNHLLGLRVCTKLPKFLSGGSQNFGFQEEGEAVDI